MPRIVSDLVAPELTRMIRDDCIAQQHDAAFAVGKHQSHSAGGARICLSVCNVTFVGGLSVQKRPGRLLA
jgi:hypothetical protein